MTRKKTFARDTHAISEARKPKFKIKATNYCQLLLWWLSTRSMQQGSIAGMNGTNWLYY
jgi:hypothetical protein